MHVCSSMIVVRIGCVVCMYACVDYLINVVCREQRRVNRKFPTKLKILKLILNYKIEGGWKIILAIGKRETNET